jgi:hypothetical protein
MIIKPSRERFLAPIFRSFQERFPTSTHLPVEFNLLDVDLDEHAFLFLLKPSFGCELGFFILLAALLFFGLTFLCHIVTLSLRSDRVAARVSMSLALPGSGSLFSSPL